MVENFDLMRLIRSSGGSMTLGETIKAIAESKKLYLGDEVCKVVKDTSGRYVTFHPETNMCIGLTCQDGTSLREKISLKRRCL